MRDVSTLRRLFFYQNAYHAEMYRKKNGEVGYSPACAKRFSDECKAQGYRCDTCQGRELVPLTDELLEKHLQGTVTLGAYQLREDGTVGWGCMDVDMDEDTEQAREHVRIMTGLLTRRVTGMGLPVVVEDTGNRGYHIWLFTPEGAPADLVRDVLEWALNSVQEDQGEFYGIHVEVFPKQTQLKAGEFGNLVKVPLGLHKKTGRRCLLVNDDLEPVSKTIVGQLAYLGQVGTLTANELLVIASEWLPDKSTGTILHREDDRESRPRPRDQARLSWNTQDFINNGSGTGTRNDRLFKAAADLAGNSFPEAEARDILTDAAVMSGLSPDETARTIASAYSKPRWPAIPNHDEIANGEATTDMRNARRFVLQHGADLRFCAPMGGWLVWDGRRWTADDNGMVMRLAKLTVQRMYGEADGIPDQEDRIKFIRSVMHCETLGKLKAMIETAESEHEVSARVEDFDTDPWLLNVANGTIDLRSGEIREHRREDLITHVAPVGYHPDSFDGVLEGYLSKATAKDPAFARYLQKAAGYTLTGLTDEETVFLVLGPGATGKSTLVEAMISMLGDYGIKTSFDTFLVQRNIGGARPDLVAMRGARMVAAVEPEKGRKLAASTLKEITGGDTISARDLYKPPFSFKPTFKIWLAANDSPELPDDDSGLWRRLQRLPFESVILPDERDPEVKRHLTSDGGESVLAWAVAGCLLWQEEKLKPPKIVRDKTAELRRDFDPLAEFFADRCIVDPGVEVEASALRRSYDDWARQHGSSAISNREWGHRLQALGCRRDRRRSMGGPPKVLWIGIGILTNTSDDDQDDEPDFFQGTERMPF